MESYYLECDYDGIVHNAYSSFTELEDFDIRNGTHISKQVMPESIKAVIEEFIQGSQKYRLVKNLPVGGNIFDLKLIDKDHTFVCMMSQVSIDVSVKSELESNKNTFRVLVDATFDIIWSFDLDYKLTAANKAFFELRRKANNSQIRIGDNIFKDVSEITRQKWLPLYKKILDEGLPYKFEEKRWVGDEESYVLISLNPIKDENGKVQGCMGITHDITALRKQKELLKIHNDSLQKITNRLETDIYEPIEVLNQLISLETDSENLTQHQLENFRKVKEITADLHKKIEELKNVLLKPL